MTTGSAPHDAQRIAPTARTRARVALGSILARPPPDDHAPRRSAEGAIGVAVIALARQLAVASWPALAPFVVGAVLAYAVLPIANRLDRFMPRVLAALLAELVAVAMLVGVVARRRAAAAQRPDPASPDGCPTPDEIQAWRREPAGPAGHAPRADARIVLAVVTEAAANLQGVAPRPRRPGGGSSSRTRSSGIFGTA